MSANQLSNMIDSAVSKIKDMVNTNTVIGEPIVLPNGITAVPVCKVSVGFGSGGSDIPTRSSAEMFGGGTGAGVSVVPIAFLVTTKDGNVKILQLDTIGTTADNIVRTVPDVIDWLSDIINGVKAK
ncbi:MAG: spore germination protein GerW family protein [Oscillospiraceae bacterium]